MCDKNHNKPPFIYLLNLKPIPWKNTPKVKQFKLFRYSTEDYLRGYQAMSKSALGAEIGADYYNIDSMIKESRN